MCFVQTTSSEKTNERENENDRHVLTIRRQRKWEFYSKSPKEKEKVFNLHTKYVAREPEKDETTRARERLLEYYSRGELTHHHQHDLLLVAVDDQQPARCHCRKAAREDVHSTDEFEFIVIVIFDENEEECRRERVVGDENQHRSAFILERKQYLLERGIK